MLAKSPILAALAGAVALIAGCAASPIEGEALDRLKADVASLKPGETILAGVGPQRLTTGGPEATVVLPYLSHGTQVAEFPIYDAYFKVAFVVVDELRALGFPAAASPRIWTARAESVAFEIRGLDDQTVDMRLEIVAQMLHATDPRDPKRPADANLRVEADLLALGRLRPVERRDLLVSFLVLLPARSGLPPALRAQPASKSDILDRYFTSGAASDGNAAPHGAHEAALALAVEAVELEARSEEGSPIGIRRGRAKLHCRLVRRDGRVIADRDVTCVATAEGSGVRVDKKGGSGLSYAFTMGPDDPLEQAIRGCVRRLVADALPELRAAP